MEIFLGTLFIVICLLLIIVVLLQKGRGGGLGAAFGGAGSSAFGTRTGDVFTWVTIVLVALFLLMSVVTTLLMRPEAPMVQPVALEPPINVISGPTNVSMSCATEGAVVHYTTDGTEPTADSPAYEKMPVEVSVGTLLTARAYKPGWKPSPVLRVIYISPEQAAAAESQPASQPGVELPAEAPVEAPADG